MALTNVERRALTRVRRQDIESGRRRERYADTDNTTDTNRARSETSKVAWTPEQIANFVRRIGPIPVSQQSK